MLIVLDHLDRNILYSQCSYYLYTSPYGQSTIYAHPFCINSIVTYSIHNVRIIHTLVRVGVSPRVYTLHDNALILCL